MRLPDLDRDSDRTLLALLGITALALLGRLVLLGDRIAHWDEGRVGYEILRYMATGSWEYRPIVHGPFLPQVNKHVFALLGANDFTARLVVALVGGLLPLAAWLYRDHLRDVELVGVALFLAADPLLVYYSRFMRNDVVVAAFAFVGLGLFVRLVDTGRRRYLFAGTAAVALAFTAKENAVLYPVSILGGLVLLLDHRLFLAREGDPSWETVARRRLRGAAASVWRYRFAILVAAVEFLAIIVFFYAPRSGAPDGVGLWNAFGRPSMFPQVIEAATLGAADKLISQWVTGGLSEHGYLPFLGHYLKVLGGASGPLALLAVLGFLADRYRGDRPRDLVALGFYWGFVSVLGYPIAVDINAAWTVVHAVVPLAIPAAAGAALIYDWGTDALADDDQVSVGLAAILILLVGAQVAGTTVTTSYLDPQGEDNLLVQYAQPEGEMRPALEATHRAARDNEGVDVAWYGGHFFLRDESMTDQLPVAGPSWYNRLPLPWYLEAYGANVTSVNRSARMERLVEERRPPVVITREQERGEIERHMEGYRAFVYEGRQFSLEFVFYVEEAYAPGAGDNP